MSKEEIQALVRAALQETDDQVAKYYKLVEEWCDAVCEQTYTGYINLVNTYKLTTIGV